jgi:hypothetical protein
MNRLTKTAEKFLISQLRISSKDVSNFFQNISCKVSNNITASLFARIVDGNVDD